MTVCSIGTKLTPCNAILRMVACGDLQLAGSRAADAVSPTGGLAEGAHANVCLGGGVLELC